MSSKEGDNEAATSHDIEKDNDDGPNSSKTSNTSDLDEEPTNDVVLTLRDPTYLNVLHQYFKKLGPKTSPNNPDFTEAMAAKEVFDMFKNKGGKFLKLKNGRTFEGGYIEVDDDEAMDSEYDYLGSFDHSARISVCIFGVSQLHRSSFCSLNE